MAKKDDMMVIDDYNDGSLLLAWSHLHPKNAQHRITITL